MNNELNQVEHNRTTDLIDRFFAPRNSSSLFLMLLNAVQIKHGKMYTVLQHCPMRMSDHKMPKRRGNVTEEGFFPPRDAI